MSLSKTLYCLVLFKPRKTHPDMTEKLLATAAHKSRYGLGIESFWQKKHLRLLQPPFFSYQVSSSLLEQFLSYQDPYILTHFDYFRYHSNHNFHATKETNTEYNQHIYIGLHTKFHQASLRNFCYLGINKFLQHFDYFRYHSNHNFHATAKQK